MDGRAGRSKAALSRKPGGSLSPRREEHSRMVLVLGASPEFRHVILNQPVTRSRSQLLSAKPFCRVGRASYALTRFLLEGFASALRVCSSALANDFFG
jgi:hypothetical protein